MSISLSCSTSSSDVPNSAPSPRPRAFLCAMNDLLREANVAFCAFRLNVIEQDRLAVAGSFAKPDVARNNGRKELRSKEFFQVLHDLIGEVRALVIHGQEHTLDLELRIFQPPDLAEGFHQLGNAFQREILALYWNQNTLRRDQRVYGEDVKRWRAINKNVVKVR